MYTSIVSCNVKKNKFCSSTWSKDPVTQQPVSSCVSGSGGGGLGPGDGYAGKHRLSSDSYHPHYASSSYLESSQERCDEEDEDMDHDDEDDNENAAGIKRKKQKRPLMPLPSMDGVPLGLEFLINLNQIVVKRMVELFDIMREYETGHYKLYNIVNGSNQRIYFAAVNSTPRENCCDVQRKFKVSIVDYSGRVVLILDRPYSCCLDVTNNCWMCCCCWLGSIGGKVSVKQPDGTLLGQILHSFGCYRPKYTIVDADGVSLMKIDGRSCGDCCNVVCAYCSCNKSKEFLITSEDRKQVLGKIKKHMECATGIDSDEEEAYAAAKAGGYNNNNCKEPISFGVEFPKNLGLKWKALIVGALFLLVCYICFASYAGLVVVGNIKHGPRIMAHLDIFLMLFTIWYEATGYKISCTSKMDQRLVTMDIEVS